MTAAASVSVFPLPGMGPPIVAGFFAAAAFAFFLFLQFLGARMFARARERSDKAPRFFFVALLSVGLAGTLASCFVSSNEGALVLGMASGVLLWTALGDVADQMGWVSTLSRSAVLTFLPSFAVWLALTFLIRGIPMAVKGSGGYVVLVWGLHLTRVRMLARWGPESLAATIHALVTALLAGAALALGMVNGTPFSGIISGVAFAMAAWSTMEIIWERGMAKGPWRLSGSGTDGGTMGGEDLD
jgi:hypothetical protein